MRFYMFKEIDVIELNEKFKSKQEFLLLDVRKDQEVMVSKINDSIHIPMNKIPSRLNEIDKNKEIIVQCKSGKRSAKVCEFLIQKGFPDVKNLAGGILAWAKHIDNSIIVY